MNIPSKYFLTTGILAAATLFVAAETAANTLRTNVNNATGILASRQGSADPISQQALDGAKGVAIVDISKGGFVIGGTGGSGVVLLKSGEGVTVPPGSAWTAPIPVTFSGGSFGAQIGGSNTKAVVLLKTDRAVNTFINPGEIRWSASASGVAGTDVAREEKSDGLTDSDITVYQDTTGVYGGAVIGGAALAINDSAIHEAYGRDKFLRDIIEGRVGVPDYSGRLINLLNGVR